LYLFPSVAKYKGSGNSADAANRVCVKGIANDMTRDADAVVPDRGDGDRDDRPGDQDQFHNTTGTTQTPPLLTIGSGY